MNVLNPVRTIPLLPWSAERPAWTWQRPVTLAVLFLGLWLFGTGEAGLINAGLGNTPWTVLAQGIARQTPLDIGTATIVISIVVLLGWIPLRQRPGIGTVANVIVIGVAIDVMTHVVPHPHALVLRGAQAALAIVTVGLGSAFYLTANLGPGPRDGWMTGINRRFGYPIAGVRASIELTVLVVGFVLGGTAGVATIAFALLIGYCLALILRVFVALRPAEEPVPATDPA
ncbi:MAG TPA: hypothetical protein VFB25_11740 [Gaiellaceae bacterium]|nr:hypothetical protein [Gaiellaceae bacterium]